VLLRGLGTLKHSMNSPGTLPRFVMQINGGLIFGYSSYPTLHTSKFTSDLPEEYRIVIPSLDYCSLFVNDSFLRSYV
jgi:hypothetical protein